MKSDEDISAKDEKKAIIKHLVNLANPETVSFAKPEEVDNMSLLLSLGSELQNFREKILGSECVETILLTYVKDNFITRFSIRGKRSEQLVEVSKSLLQDDDKKSLDVTKKLKF